MALRAGEVMLFLRCGRRRRAGSEYQGEGTKTRLWNGRRLQLAIIGYLAQLDVGNDGRAVEMRRFGPVGKREIRESFSVQAHRCK